MKLGKIKNNIDLRGENTITFLSKFMQYYLRDSMIKDGSFLSLNLHAVDLLL